MPTGSNNTRRRSVAADVAAVLLFAAAALLMLGLVTYNPADPSWDSVGPDRAPSNLIGGFGAYSSDFFFQVFGLAAFSIPLLLTGLGLRALFGENPGLRPRRVIGSFLLLIALSGFLALFPNLGIPAAKGVQNGGVLGVLVEGSLAGIMNTAGAAIVLAAASLLTLMLAMEVSLSTIWNTAERVVSAWRPIRERRETRKAIVTQASVQGAPSAPSRGLVARFQDWRSARADARRGREKARRLAAARAEALRQAGRIDPEIDLAVTPRSRAVPVSRAQAAPGQESEASEPGLADASLSTAQAVAGAGSSSDYAGQISVRKAAASSRGASRDAGRPGEERRRPQPGDITMDPTIAEMVSTVEIVSSLEDPDSVARLEEEERRVIKKKTRPQTSGVYRLPSLDLLETPVSHREQAEEELKERATTLAEKCKEFSVTGHIHRINPGPVVTTFEFKPDPGVKYSRVVSLADDLCLALKAESIRIDRIPGKSTVGIEVPNAHREKIYLREVIESPRLQDSESKLVLALGKTINGEEYVADLTKMPHLLIAGATGAGKSVTLNAIICSILYKASPEDVKFIMVDPKRLELGLYEGIPHLLTPIVTEPKRAANALKWATNEMENRYRELAKFGVRNIDQYNQLVHPTLSAEDSEAPRRLPYIVITIDELADLMMIARGDVETSIARLAQMARAVGIHLVVATQRPSVDVITGVIKANFPSRIAFRVSSKVDSRTIIDSNGAEALLGQGDMLFLPPASSRLVRVHGSFVNEAEIERITDHHRNQAKPDYNEQVTQSEQEGEDGTDLSGERDEMFEQALAIVTDMGRASTSVLQRRLSIGYGRAAKILDSMEKGGFIGPVEGAKPRKVLQSAYEFRERLGQRLEERAD